MLNLKMPNFTNLMHIAKDLCIKRTHKNNSERKGKKQKAKTTIDPFTR